MVAVFLRKPGRVRAGALRGDGGPGGVGDYHLNAESRGPLAANRSSRPPRATLPRGGRPIFVDRLEALAGPGSGAALVGSWPAATGTLSPRPLFGAPGVRCTGTPWAARPGPAGLAAAARPTGRRHSAHPVHVGYHRPLQGRGLALTTSSISTRRPRPRTRGRSSGTNGPSAHRCLSVTPARASINVGRGAALACGAATRHLPRQVSSARGAPSGRELRRGRGDGSRSSSVRWRRSCSPTRTARIPRTTAYTVPVTSACRWPAARGRVRAPLRRHGSCGRGYGMRPRSRQPPMAATIWKPGGARPAPSVARWTGWTSGGRRRDGLCPLAPGRDRASWCSLAAALRHDDRVLRPTPEATVEGVPQRHVPHG